MNTASGDEEEDEGETHAPVHFSLCDSDELETRSKGQHEGTTIRQVDDILLEMKDVKSELQHVRELIGVLVRKERCAETRAEIAARRLDRLERGQDEQDDKDREANLQEALGDKTKVVKSEHDACRTLASETCARTAERSSTWCAGKGSST